MLVHVESFDCRSGRSQMVFPGHMHRITNVLICFMFWWFFLPLFENTPNYSCLSGGGGRHVECLRIPWPWYGSCSWASWVWGSFVCSCFDSVHLFGWCSDLNREEFMTSSLAFSRRVLFVSGSSRSVLAVQFEILLCSCLRKKLFLLVRPSCILISCV